tara:strand:- start:2184 stop:3272 length:1089 start_codon:yes stop_codon:yes gene_type:complete
MATEPVVVHDFTSQPGQTVQLDRYKFWGQPGTKDSRERISDQTIGTANSRNITKEKVLVVLKEYTGPADPGDPTQPSTFKIARETLVTAQRLLLDTGNLNMFHQSIGSLTLLDDYRRWRDRVFIDELAKAEAQGQANSKQGGYYFAGDKAKNAQNQITYTAAEFTAQVQQFSVRTDLLEVVKDLRKRNVPTFADGMYRCICDPTFMMHLRRDEDFREIARYSGNPGQGMYMANPMMPNNTSFYMGPQAGQGYFLAGEPVMPTGVQFEGVKFFESTNFPTKAVQASFTGAAPYAAEEVAQGFFFGPQSIGVGIGGPNAQVLINNNDDFSRFIILIWQLYAGFEVLNTDFITTAFSFVADDGNV